MPIGGSAHDDAVDRGVEAELHGQMFDIDVVFLAPLPHRVGLWFVSAIGFDPGEAAHTEDAGEN